MKKFILFLGILASSGAFAQTKIKDGTISSPITPNAAAIIELESNNKGLLLTRVELTNTTTWGLAGAGVQGMLVYNTLATITSTDAAYPVLTGGKGVYYWDGTGWVATKMTAGLEPWNVESTSTSATANTQNIYQNGNVGIGDFTATNPIAKLDVRGAIRGGEEPNPDELSGASPIGYSSVAFGGYNRASGALSAAFGFDNLAAGTFTFVAAGQGGNKAYGQGSVILGGFANTTGSEAGLGTSEADGSGIVAGVGHKITGANSFIGGGGANEITKYYSAIVGGYGSVINGDYSFASGWRLQSDVKNTFMLGRYNAITGGDADNIYTLTNPLFQLGNGDSRPFPVLRSNALTVLQNGNTGIAIPGVEEAAKPTSTLHVAGSLSLALRVVSTAATLTDKDHTIVYTGATSTTMTLPDPATCKGRIYRIIQYITDGQGTIDITFDRNIYCFDIDTMAIIQTMSLWSAHRQFIAGGETGFSTSVTIQSDGANWYAVGL